MKTLFEQKMTMLALKAKFGDTDRMIMDNIRNDDELVKQGKLKNVCAALSPQLTERLEKTLDLLDMSKRSFFELAIIDALDKAENIIKENYLDDEAA